MGPDRPRSRLLDRWQHLDRCARRFAAQQLTRFSDDRRIQDFAWSHDGSRLAVVRFTTSTDIVLLRLR